MIDYRAITLLLMNSPSWGEEYPSKVQPLTLVHMPRSGKLVSKFPNQLN